MAKAKRGEIWEVEFRPSVGAEIQKLRPAVVMNIPEVGRLPLCIVIPVTDWKPVFAQFSWFVPLAPSSENGLLKLSGADAFQIKSVSEGRLVHCLGRIKTLEIEQIAAAIALCIGYEAGKP
jgi:mRNA interferase MazF